MVELPGERPPVTWGELSSEHSEVTEEWEAMKAYRAQMGIDIH
jgi:dihydropyrimidine dehydrogenase (NAD+) subunit PreA